MASVSSTRPSSSHGGGENEGHHASTSILSFAAVAVAFLRGGVCGRIRGKRRLVAVLVCALYISIYSSFNVIAHWSLGQASVGVVVLIVACRQGGASLLALLGYLARSRCRPRRLFPRCGDVARIAGTGIMSSLVSVTFALGLSMTSSINASVAHSMMPAVTNIASTLIGFQPFRWERILGIVVAVMGALIVVFADETGKAAHTQHRSEVVVDGGPGLRITRDSIGIFTLAVFLFTYSGQMLLVQTVVSPPNVDTRSMEEEEEEEGVARDGAEEGAATEEEAGAAGGKEEEEEEEEEEWNAAAAVEPADGTPVAYQEYAPDHFVAMSQGFASGTTLLSMLLLYICGLWTVDEVAQAAMQPKWLLTLLYGAVVVNTVGFVLETTAIKMLGSATTTLGISFDPAMTMFLSTLFLRHRPPLLALPGVVAIVGGVALATLVKHKEKARVKKMKDEFSV